MKVAVKVPIKQQLTEAELLGFRNEVKMMSKIFHPNVVLFLGACTQLGRLQIVTELCGGDLESVLKNDRKEQKLSLQTRMEMARDAALGMNWLHEITKICHNDLKSANLLVSLTGKVKVADFGFSLMREGRDFSGKSAKGTPLWMAPEVLLKQSFNEKADVYSFGIIMWEIFTREEPFPHHNDLQTFTHAVCVKHERPIIPADCPTNLKNLMMACWEHHPANRPSFHEIVMWLNEIIVDCAIDDVLGRRFWKRYFLAAKEELLTEVDWPEFEHAIIHSVGLPSHTPKSPYGADTLSLETLKNLLIPPSGHASVNAVTMESFDRVSKWFGPFFTAEYGPSIIQEVNILTSKSWFHGNISREEAVIRITRYAETAKKDNVFLIRMSATDPKEHPFTLSMQGDKHRRIQAINEGGSSANGTPRHKREFKIQGHSTVYPSVLDLVEKCKEYKLKNPCLLNTNSWEEEGMKEAYEDDAEKNTKGLKRMTLF
eukprot:TRINITY_DN6756_c0_g1_i5.p1 TRINITY_DN6756_c0_g1~~TRINITY_DN6756_c0_g1_i5.p1  ORF type:complete len:569 (+),score=117.23 TRINITY_DN6756_c0_g1_i5:251-1708(+)